MSVHKPKFQNIPGPVRQRFIQHHLPYELWMMGEALKAAIRGAPTQYQHNVDVEALALHARNLIEFLKNGDNCSYDPTNFTTKEFSIDRTFIRPTLVDKINEQIQHLTAKRTEEPKEKLVRDDWIEAVEAIEKEFARWSKNLSTEWAAEWEKRERMGESVVDEGKALVQFVGGSSAPEYVHALPRRNETATPSGAIFNVVKPISTK